jgi:hypothetical protein
MKDFTRRIFMQGAGAVGALIGIPATAKVASELEHHHATEPAVIQPPNGANPKTEDPAQEAAPRSSVSMTDNTQLPFGVWLGLGFSRHKELVEVDYHGYERYWLTSGSQMEGRSGFYRLRTTLDFPGRKSGTLVASHLLVFQSDRIEPNYVKPIAAFELPRRISAPPNRIVQIRDVNIDLHGGLLGDWRDADDLLDRRLKTAFQTEAMGTA